MILAMELSWHFHTDQEAAPAARAIPLHQPVLRLIGLNWLAFKELRIVVDIQRHWHALSICYTSLPASAPRVGALWQFRRRR